MKKFSTLFMMLLAIILLSACMYPDDELAKNKIPYEDQIKSVQSSVDQFREKNNGLLPIKTKEVDTPIYQKYPIDFKKIVPAFMAEIPGNAYENGGVFQYVLVDVEADPQVKLLDLMMVDTIRDIKLRIQSQGFPPFKERVSDNLFTLDFKKIGYKKDPVAVSPFTQKNLPFLIDGKGEIYVDYRIDLYEKLKNKEYSYQEGDDIRGILVQDSNFVPAFSVPYTIDLKTNEPIFLAN